MAGKSYHIYIHNETQPSGGGKKPTVPDKPDGGGKKPTVPDKPGGGKIPTIPGVVPGSGVVNTAIRMINGNMGAYGAIAAVVAAVRTAEQVVTAMNNVVAPLTGDYSFQMGWDNFMQMQNNVFHPISSSVNAVLQTEKWEAQRAKKAEERTLLGDTALNTLTKEV